MLEQKQKESKPSNVKHIQKQKEVWCSQAFSSSRRYDLLQ